MVYRMEFEVDGACRGNGKPGSIGAAVAVHLKRSGKHNYWTQILSYPPTPTNQRAEIAAIILAQEQALAKYDELNGNPRFLVKIYSDSKYAVGCMNEWIYRWEHNGWVNAAGRPVANQGLIQEASRLGDRLAVIGSVEYIWIPREENQLADRYCNDALDEAAENEYDRNSDDSW